MKELCKIQAEANAPKSRHNNFGNYDYRSAEDILKATKPILAKYECTLTLSDSIVMVGNRIYIQATATLTNAAGEQTSVSGFAREDESKKGMDSAQVTGSCSSYARKYALNGLFAIDDGVDSDSLPENKTAKKAAPKKDQSEYDSAMAAIAAATEVQQLATIFNAHPSLQSDKGFVSSLTKRKKELA